MDRQEKGSDKTEGDSGPVPSVYCRDESRFDEGNVDLGKIFNVVASTRPILSVSAY